MSSVHLRSAALVPDLVNSVMPCLVQNEPLWRVSASGLVRWPCRRGQQAEFVGPPDEFTTGARRRASRASTPPACARCSPRRTAGRRSPARWPTWPAAGSSTSSRRVSLTATGAVTPHSCRPAKAPRWRATVTKQSRRGGAGGGRPRGSTAHRRAAWRTAPGCRPARTRRRPRRRRDPPDRTGRPPSWRAAAFSAYRCARSARESCREKMPSSALATAPSKSEEHSANRAAGTAETEASPWASS